MNYSQDYYFHIEIHCSKQYSITERHYSNEYSLRKTLKSAKFDNPLIPFI